MLDEVIYIRVSIASTLFQCCLSPSSVPVNYFISCKMKWCCPCSLQFGRVCLYNTQPSVVPIFLPWQNQQEGPLFSGFTSKITLKLKYWDPDESSVWSCSLHCSEVSSFFSKMGCFFFFFTFPTVGGRLTSSERTFIKRTHESAADTFKDVVKHPTPTGLFGCFFFFETQHNENE